MTPGFISDTRPQFHTANYVYSYLTGRSAATSAGLAFISMTSVNGNYGKNGPQDWGYETGVGVGPYINFGFSHTQSFTWSQEQIKGPWNY